MQFSAKILRAGLVGLWIGGLGASLPAQSPVPDAPRPQTLPPINSITPTAPASVPNAPLPNGPTPQPSTASAATTAAATPATAPAANGAAADAINGGGPMVRHQSDIVVVVNYHQIPFVVKDAKGALVPGLTERDVRVYENGLLQSPRLFTADPTPLSVALVIDQSVTFDTMEKINASLTALQNAFTPYDEVAIYTYNNGVKEQTSFSGAQSARITFALENSKGKGREPLMPLGGPLAQTTVKNNQGIDPNTNGNNNTTLTQGQNAPREFHTLNDAILTAAVQVAKAGRNRRRVIYVISDGREYGSQAKETEVIHFLQQNNIAVYATLVGDASVPGEGFLDKLHIPLQMRDNVLPRYVAATGGDYAGAFRPRAIEDSFTHLAEEVRGAYVVGYYSHEPFIDGKYRSTEVRVMRPNLQVSAEKGYFPRADSTPPVPATRPGTSGASTSTATTGAGSPTTP